MHNIIDLTNAYLLMINELVKQKAIEQLTSFEKLCYVYKNGIDDTTLRVKDQYTSPRESWI